MRKDSGAQYARTFGGQQHILHETKWFAWAIALGASVVIGAISLLPHPSSATIGCMTSGTPSASIDTPSDLVTEVDVMNSMLVVRLSWDDNSDNETCFVVERKTEESVFAAIGIVAADTVMCVDSSLPDDELLTYRVYAASAGARSAYSNEAGVVLPQSGAGSGAGATPTAPQETSCNTVAETPTPSVPASGTPVTPGPTPAGHGDIDCNGTIDAQDALALLSHVAGLSQLPMC